MAVQRSTLGTDQLELPTVFRQCIDFLEEHGTQNIILTVYVLFVCPCLLLSFISHLKTCIYNVYTCIYIFTIIVAMFFKNIANDYHHFL